MVEAESLNPNGEVARKVSKVVRSLFAIAIGLSAATCGEGDAGQTSTGEITHEQVRQYLLEHPELVLDDPEIANSISRARSADPDLPLLTGWSIGVRAMPFWVPLPEMYCWRLVSKLVTEHRFTCRLTCGTMLS